MSADLDKQRHHPRTGLTYDDILKDGYLGVLERAPDKGGFESYLDALRRGARLYEVIRKIIASEEFESRKPALVPSIVLPDLTTLYPHKYIREGADSASAHDGVRLATTGKIAESRFLRIFSPSGYESECLKTKKERRAYSRHLPMKILPSWSR